MTSFDNIGVLSIPIKFSWVAALFTFVNDVSPTVRISRVSQVSDTTRTVALTCLFAWWPSQFAVVTSFTVPFVMCCWCLVTQRVNETHHYRFNRSNHPNNFRSNEISATFKRRSEFFLQLDLRQTANNFVLRDDHCSVLSTGAFSTTVGKVPVVNVPHTKRFFNAGIMCCSNRSDPVIKSSSTCTPSMPSSDSPRRHRNILGWVWDRETPTSDDLCRCSAVNPKEASFKPYTAFQTLRLCRTASDRVTSWSRSTEQKNGRLHEMLQRVIRRMMDDGWWNRKLVTNEQISGACVHHRLPLSIQECRRSASWSSSQAVQQSARDLKLQRCHVPLQETSSCNDPPRGVSSPHACSRTVCVWNDQELEILKIRIRDFINYHVVEGVWTFGMLLIRDTQCVFDTSASFCSSKPISHRRCQYTHDPQFIPCRHDPQNVVFARWVAFQCVCLQWHELLVELFLFGNRNLEVTLGRAREWTSTDLTSRWHSSLEGKTLELATCLRPLSVSGRVGIPVARDPIWRWTARGASREY